MDNLLKNIYQMINNIYIAYANVPFGLYWINKEW